MCLHAYSFNTRIPTGYDLGRRSTAFPFIKHHRSASSSSGSSALPSTPTGVRHDKTSLLSIIRLSGQACLCTCQSRVHYDKAARYMRKTGITTMRLDADGQWTPIGMPPLTGTDLKFSPMSGCRCNHDIMPFRVHGRSLKRGQLVFIRTNNNWLPF